MTEHYTIIEVGPRDGLQNVASFIPTTCKKDFIETLAESGLKRIEITAFVSSKKIPQMADASALCEALHWYDTPKYECLIPNPQGFEAAALFPFQTLSFFTSPSERFCFENIGCTIEESLARYQQIRAMHTTQKSRVYLSCLWGCPYTGTIKLSKIMRTLHTVMAMGADEISLGDTLGTATPAQTKILLNAIAQEYGLKQFAVHFHDTHHRALHNLDQALECGIHMIDAAANGLGGCPYAPGAKGNIATQEVVRYLRRHGIETNIDTQIIDKASKTILPFLDGSP